MFGKGCQIPFRARILTEQEQQHIIELYQQHVPRRDIANIIKVDYSTIREFFQQNQIQPHETGIPHQLQADICQLYQQGYTCKQIRDNYYPQYSTDQINYVCRKHHITRPSGTQTIVQHDYFHIIDTHEKAYWLGLFSADGCVTRNKQHFNCLNLELMQSDNYLLQQLRQAISLHNPVRDYTNPTGFQRKDGKPHIQSRLRWCSTKMAQDLAQYGVLPRKSQTLRTVPTLPTELLRDYIRGYFDGNGTVTYDKNRRPRLGFYGTHDFCDSLNQCLHHNFNTTLNKVYDQKKTQVSFISFSSYHDIAILWTLLYENVQTPYLQRKYNKFKQLKEQAS